MREWLKCFCKKIPSNTSTVPQVILHISARIGRTAWKYKTIAFMFMKQGMCGLSQTFHLVATALSSEPCALGSVSVGQLGTALATDWREDPFLEVFTLRE